MLWFWNRDGGAIAVLIRVMISRGQIATRGMCYAVHSKDYIGHIASDTDLGEATPARAIRNAQPAPTSAATPGTLDRGVG